MNRRPAPALRAVGARAHPERGENSGPEGRRGPMCGELLTFDDPETRARAIDRLEGFLPMGPASTGAC